jgi:hypothetical protein
MLLKREIKKQKRVQKFAKNIKSLQKFAKKVLTAKAPIELVQMRKGR